MGASLLEGFISYLAAERRYSALTVRNYRRDVERLVAWLGFEIDNFDPTRITVADLRGWVLHRLEEEHISPAAVNREVSSIRTLFRWLLREGHVDLDPTQRLPALHVSKRLPVFVPESQMTTIVDRCKEQIYDPEQGENYIEAFTSQRDALIVLMFYACGLRLAELVAINLDHFSDGYTRLRVRGKGDKERIVPIVEPLRKAIARYRAEVERQKICISPQKALFLSVKGERISRSTVYRAVHGELTEGGVAGKRSPHVLRHTFATLLLNGGADMREIQELMGHASLQATQVYTHNSITQLQEAYLRAHPRERAAAEERRAQRKREEER